MQHNDLQEQGGPSDLIMTAACHIAGAGATDAGAPVHYEIWKYNQSTGKAHAKVPQSIVAWSRRDNPREPEGRAMGQPSIMACETLWHAPPGAVKLH